MAAVNPQVRVIEFGEWVCPDPTRRCRTSLAGTPLSRADGVHYVGQQAKVVWSLLLPEIMADAGVS